LPLLKGGSADYMRDMVKDAYKMAIDLGCKERLERNNRRLLEASNCYAVFTVDTLGDRVGACKILHDALDPLEQCKTPGGPDSKWFIINMGKILGKLDPSYRS
jgi:hypothetical protein